MYGMRARQQNAIPFIFIIRKISRWLLEIRGHGSLRAEQIRREYFPLSTPICTETLSVDLSLIVTRPFRIAVKNGI
jgi:hypothetical protein